MRRGVRIATFAIGVCIVVVVALAMRRHQCLPPVVAAPPADVAVYVSHREACEAIAATSGDDEQPWAEHGCYGLGSEEAPLRLRYAGQKQVLQLLEWHKRLAVQSKRPQPVPPWLWAGQPVGGWWTPADLDWHNRRGADAPDSVAVIDNELVVVSADGRAAQLTLDGVAKSDPVFSPDGNYIAFLEPVDRRQGVGQIVIIDRLGHEVRRLNVQPPNALIPQPSMQFRKPGAPIAWQSVARFQWAGDDRIAVQSSLNVYPPRAFLILNVGTGKVVDSFIDAGSRVAFSHDGKHYFYKAGMPLGYICTCVPPVPVDPITLRTDEGVVATPTDQYIGFGVGPVWSADGQMLFVEMTDKQRMSHILTWSHGRATLLEGTLAGPVWDMYEKNGDLFVVDNVPDGTKYRQQAWIFTGRRSPAVALNPNLPFWNPIYWPMQHREWLERAVARARPDARTPDFWCADCDLALLPRMSNPPHGLYGR